MKGRIVWLLLSVTAVLGACVSREDFPPQDVAANTAKLYYQYLIDGKYEDFVAGMVRHVEWTENDRRQMVENAKSFVSQQKDLHQGMRNVSAIRSQVDSVEHTAMVFLMMEFADNTKEEILVPMVEKDSLWLMR